MVGWNVSKLVAAALRRGSYSSSLATMVDPLPFHSSVSYRVLRSDRATYVRTYIPATDTSLVREKLVVAMEPSFLSARAASKNDWGTTGRKKGRCMPPPAGFFEGLFHPSSTVVVVCDVGRWTDCKNVRDPCGVNLAGEMGLLASKRPCRSSCSVSRCCSFFPSLSRATPQRTCSLTHTCALH